MTSSPFPRDNLAGPQHSKTTQPTVLPQSVILQEALDDLDNALLALWEAQARMRWQTLLRRFLRPSAFVLTCFCIGGLSLLFWRFGVPVRYCFSLAVLCYMIPLFSSLWWRPGTPDLSLFWAEIRRADEVIMEQTDRELWLWPEQHPQDLVETEAGFSTEQLRRCVENRQQQLQRAWAECRDSAPVPDPEQ